MTDSQHRTDETLVERYVASGRRDETIFKELFHRRRQDVWRVCYAFFGNPQDAEDLTQQVFFSAYRAMGQYRGQASVRTWLHRIASNACKNELRRRSRRPEGTETVLEEEGSVVSVPAAAEQNVSLQRRTDRLGRALGALRDEDRQLLLMVEFEGRRYAEIASHLELSVAAIKMRVMRARLALKSAYEALENEEVSL